MMMMMMIIYFLFKCFVADSM